MGSGDKSSSAAPAQSGANAIAFVDSSLKDYQALVSAISSG